MRRLTDHGPTRSNAGEAGGTITPGDLLANVIEIDGSEGGGQLVRTALALSALSETPVRMSAIRGGRPDPGLKRQHLAAVRALAAATDADVSGADLDSETLTFDPGRPRPGEYAVDIGTAGSVTLAFDAALPLAAGIDGRMTLTVTGGTDVKWSPTADYYRRVKLPLVRRAGVLAAVDWDRRGFYPAGGGRATLTLGPSTPSFSLDERGDPGRARVFSTADDELSGADVAERQARTATESLREAGIDVTERVVEYVDAACPGSALAIALDYGDARAGFDALGERGTPAEAVAEEAVDAALAHRAGTAVVDAHMADQVVALLALGGGRVRAPETTAHLASSLELLSTFGYDVAVDPVGDDVVISSDGGGEADRTNR